MLSALRLSAGDESTWSKDQTPSIAYMNATDHNITINSSDLVQIKSPLCQASVALYVCSSRRNRDNPEHTNFCENDANDFAFSTELVDHLRDFNYSDVLTFLMKQMNWAIIGKPICDSTALSTGKSIRFPPRRSSCFEVWRTCTE